MRRQGYSRSELREREALDDQLTARLRELADQAIAGVDYEVACCPVCGSSDPDMTKHVECMASLNAPDTCDECGSVLTELCGEMGECQVCGYPVADPLDIPPRV